MTMLRGGVQSEFTQSVLRMKVNEYSWRKWLTVVQGSEELV